MSGEYRCRFDWRVRKAMVDGIGRICRILFDEGLIRRLVSIEPPYRVDVGGCAFKVLEEIVDVEDRESRVRIIALCDGKLKFEDGRYVNLWYYRLDYELSVKKNDVEDLKFTEKAFREVSKCAVKILEGKPIGEIGEFRLTGLGATEIEGEVKGEIPVEFRVGKEFLNGVGNLKVWAVEEVKGGAIYKVYLLASVNYERFKVDEYAKWLEKSKILKCIFNPKVRFKIAKHVRRMCELMSNPETIHRLNELEDMPNSLSVGYIDFVDLETGRIIDELSKHHFILDRYVFYRRYPKRFIALFEGKFRVYRKYHVKTWRYTIEISLDYGEFHEALTKLKLSEKDILGRIRKILTAIGNFANEILMGRRLDEVGVVKECYCMDITSYRAPRRFIKHVKVWKVYDDFILEAVIPEECLWSGVLKNDFGRLVIRYPSWQEKLKAKGKIKSREDIIEIAKQDIYTVYEPTLDTYVTLDIRILRL